MNATFADDPPIPGAIGFASQSGGLGIAILAEARYADSGCRASSPWATRQT